MEHYVLFESAATRVSKVYTNLAPNVTFLGAAFVATPANTRTKLIFDRWRAAAHAPLNAQPVKITIFRRLGIGNANDAKLFYLAFRLKSSSSSDENSACNCEFYSNFLLARMTRDF